MPRAYACLMSRENLGAIASEHPGFDPDEAEVWLLEHGNNGFFVRDEGSPLDCKYIAAAIFHQFYTFDEFDPLELFHRIFRK